MTSWPCFASTIAGAGGGRQGPGALLQINIQIFFLQPPKTQISFSQGERLWLCGCRVTNTRAGEEGVWFLNSFFPVEIQRVKDAQQL